MRLLFSILAVSISFFCGHLIAQNHAPVVSNIQVNQRSDCSFIVDISYDVNDEDGDTLTVSVLISGNNGNTWDYSYDIAHMAGDIGEDILSGTNRQITWDFSEDHPQTEGSQFKFKIIAEDGDLPGMSCPGIPSVTYGGEIYPTVQIGTQCWLQKNMNYQTANSWCYENNPANCAIYGRLYDWPAAMAVCPPGWHLASNDEWSVLLNYCGTNLGMGSLTSTSGWSTSYSHEDCNGNNISGFSALPGGAGELDYWYPQNPPIWGNLGHYAYFWTSTMSSNTIQPLYYTFMCGWGLAGGPYMYFPDSRYSVRCIKN